MRGKLKWFVAIGLAILGLTASAFVPPWKFECKLFTSCHELNLGYALVSIFSTQIQESISNEEILLRVCHSVSFTVIGAILGFLAGLLLDVRSRPAAADGGSPATVLHRPSSAPPSPAAIPSRSAELELTGLNDFHENYLRIGQSELAGMTRGLLIGRDAADSDFQVKDDTVSRQHARLSATGGQFMVEDLGSTNGTRLNGRELRPYEQTPLHTGDRLSIGSANFNIVVNRP